MRLAVILLMICLAALPAAALDPEEMFDDPVLEQRARDLGRQLRCLKCRNQSIFDSNAGIAKDLRVVVRERIVAGDSDAEILDFLQDRFGAFVLLKPPVGPQTYLLWGTPVLLLVFGLGVVAVFLRQRPAVQPPEMSDDDRAQARALLREEC